MSVLLMEPETLLLDEPFAGLDLPTQSRLRRRLDALGQRVITITHDPAAVTGADRVLWLEAGRLHMDGPPATVIPAFMAAMDHLGTTDHDTTLADEPPSC